MWTCNACAQPARVEPADFPLVCSCGARHESATQPSRGLGDTVAKITSALGVRPCGGCKSRRDKLNKLIPYKQQQRRQGEDV